MMARLETRARQDAAWFRQRAAWTALLGTAYLGMIFLLLLAVMAACIVVALRGHYGALALCIPAVLLAGTVLRALRFSPTPMQGILLRREEAPALFTLLDVLRAMVGHPRLDAVLLTGDLISEGLQRADPQRPWRLQNVLLVGLPEMLAVPPDEFRAGLLHALAHLSGQHGRFDTWYARLSQTWTQLLERLETRKHWSLFLFRPFMAWYAPAFMAHAYVLTRLVEYEADSTAAAKLGSRVLAQRLLRLAVKDRWLDEVFWPPLTARVADEPAPPAGIYPAMGAHLRAALPAAETHAWLEEALATAIQYDDLTPPLALRLEALDVVLAREGGTTEAAAHLAEAVDGTAAECYLGEALPGLLARLDDAWRARMLPEWEERHARIRTARERRTALAALAAARPLTEEEAWEDVELTMRLEEPPAAIAALRAMLAAHPRNAAANFVLGRLLLEAGDAEGLRCLECAMESDPWSTPEACDLISAFLEEQGQTLEAELYQKRAQEAAPELQAAEAERQVTNPGDTFVPHDLPEETIAGVIDYLAGCDGVQRALLVRKTTRHLPDYPFYVLAILPVPGTPAPPLLDRLLKEVPLADRGAVVILTPNKRRLQRALERVAKANIYQR
jgi:tetratricopeptide (TPR) repeat protein